MDYQTGMVASVVSDQNSPLNMHPGLSENNQANCSLAYSKNCANLCLAFPCHVKFSDFSDFLFCQNSGGVLFPWVRNLLANCASFLGVHIGDVVRKGSQEKVINVYAQPDIADVADTKVIWKVLPGEHPGKPMSWDSSLSARAFFGSLFGKANLTVSSLACGSLPYAALSRLFSFRIERLKIISSYLHDGGYTTEAFI